MQTCQKLRCAREFDQCSISGLTVPPTPFGWRLTQMTHLLLWAWHDMASYQHLSTAGTQHSSGKAMPREWLGHNQCMCVRCWICSGISNMNSVDSGVALWWNPVYALSLQALEVFFVGVPLSLYPSMQRKRFLKNERSNYHARERHKSTVVCFIAATWIPSIKHRKIILWP